MHYPSAPVGVYDSGLGGLSVVKALRAHLPNESIVYVADNARVPYGGRSPEEIRRFSQEVIDFLVEQGVKTIVCACNTSSVLILPALKRYRGVTVLGLARAGAVLPPEVKRVGLLATEATVRSQQYKQMLRLHHPFVAYEEQACPAFVPLIESGHWEGPEAEAAVQAYVAPLLQKKVDALLLGCSHYPYLAPLLTRMAPHIRLINPAEQMAHMLASFCPNVLFPYAREAVSNLVNRGTFPQLNLAPVNFDALFAQYVQRRQAEAQAAKLDA